MGTPRRDAPDGHPHPYALTQWKIEKEGYETFEGAQYGLRPFMAFGQGFTLDVEGSRPEGMVRVPRSAYEPDGLPTVELEDYWLDRYEVTNRQFKEFVDTGGYEKEEYWTRPFVGEDLELSPEAAVAHFVDTTGPAGPAGWEFGAYDAGEADHPVGGVSWSEAAAYCRSVGRACHHPPLVCGDRPGPTLGHRLRQQLRRQSQQQWEASRA